MTERVSGSEQSYKLSLCQSHDADIILEEVDRLVGLTTARINY